MDKKIKIFAIVFSAITFINIVGAAFYLFLQVGVIAGMIFIGSFVAIAIVVGITMLTALFLPPLETRFYRHHSVHRPEV